MVDIKEKQRDTAFERAVKEVFKGDYEDLGVVEDKEGNLMLPEQLKRRSADGGVKVLQDIYLRCPTNFQKISARRRAREVIQDMGLDEEKDQDFFAEFENFEILAFCIRDRKAPYDQTVINGKALFEKYDPSVLSRLWVKLSQWTNAVDPRFGELDAEECFKVVSRIAARGDASPLGDMPGYEQSTCIVFMARQLDAFLRNNSSEPLPSISNPEPSEVTSSP